MSHRFRFIARLRHGVLRARDAVADFGAALVSPIERLFHFLGRKMFAAAEGVEHLDSVVVGAGRLITWPLRALGRAVISIASILIPRSLRRFLALPFVWLTTSFQRLGAGLWRLVERLNLDRAVMWLAWLTQPLWRPIAAFGGFLYAWLVTRHYRGLLWGIPAVVLLMPVLVAAAWGLVWGRDSVATQYRVAVQKAVDAKNYEQVQFYERKLAQLGVDTQRTDFKTAAALAEDGKVLDAYDRMKRLAPTDRPGYPSAHLWIVQRLLQGELKESPEETHRLLGAHLDQLEAAGIKAPEIQLVRAAWLAETQQFTEAAELLKPLVNRLPAAAMQRMAIQINLGNREEASSDARAVSAHLEGRQRRRLDITAEEYRWWTIAKGLLADERGQMAILEAWQKKFPNDPLVKQGLAERARQEVERQFQAARPDAQVLAERILESARLGGDAGQLNRQIGILYQQRNQSPIARAAVEELVKTPDAPQIVVQLLGTHALITGDAAGASTLLKRAVEQNPNDAIAWNNYACSLLELPNTNLQEALAAVDKALAIAPDAPQFHETRGQIYVRLQRWDDAVEDLELAINGMPNSKPVHRSLAAAYAALGQQDLASVHREQSK